MADPAGQTFFCLGLLRLDGIGTFVEGQHQKIHGEAKYDDGKTGMKGMVVYHLENNTENEFQRTDQGHIGHGSELCNRRDQNFHNTKLPNNNSHE